METLQVMSTKEGHKEEHYDPENPDQVKKIMKMIKEKMKKGYYLYGSKKGGDFMVLRSEKDIEDEKLNRFLLTTHVKKRLISKPIVGG